MTVTTTRFDAQLAPRKSRGLYRDAWRRLLSGVTGRIGLAVVTIIVLLAVLVPIVAPYDPYTDSNLSASLQPPSREYPFGTDRLGRSVLRRIIYGANVSLRVGVLAVLFSTIVGTTLGLLAGYFGGWVDTLIMRMMDILLAFPTMLLAIAIVAIRGIGLTNTLLAISIVGIAGPSRVVRSMVLSIRERDYVQAAHMIGARDGRIIFRHVFPNTISPIIVQMTMGVGGAILMAAALGFLGLGSVPPTPEWGAMISDGIPFLVQAPWLVFYPGMAIMFSVLGFNLLGDGLRDALDPQMTI
jgi:peptide/nickel transport system permease protein